MSHFPRRCIDASVPPIACGRSSFWSLRQASPRQAINYFAKRKIDITIVPDQGGLRFHPAFPESVGGPTRPSIVARFTDPLTGAPGGIWHRPLAGEKPTAF